MAGLATVDNIVHIKRPKTKVSKQKTKKKKEEKKINSSLQNCCQKCCNFKKRKYFLRYFNDAVEQTIELFLKVNGHRKEDHSIKFMLILANQFA